MTDAAQIKGGKLARNAAFMCQNPEFRLWLDRRRSAKFNMKIEDGTHTEEDAKEFILRACGIASRAELDHNAAAAKMFYKIQKLFNQYLRRLNQH